jgi:GTPase SAR1 family protein
VSETPQSTQHAEGHHIAQAQGPGAIATVITNIFRGGTTEQRAMRNRQAMLQLVRNFWVKGVLEQSLHGAAMIELGLEERAEAVERPWDMVLQTPDQPNRPLPPGTKIVDVFDEMNRALLVLGEPGAGKTTMLLELARDTIARAEEDPMRPIPVVFNLSSWAEKRQPIAEWLVDELSTKYDIPNRIARSWVENDDLSLLLDGLDEVVLEHREDCVEAINDFRREHLIPLVVCSRIADYRALTPKLKLQGAVLLQPPTLKQIDEYLGSASTELSAVRETLHNDTALQELAQSPLMLSVMALAYQGVSVKDLQSLNTTEARRKHVFEAYVQRMFERRGAEQSYSPERTVHWLAWLARTMNWHGQTVFLIERMQPSWLHTEAQRRLICVASRSSFGMMIGTILGTRLVESNRALSGLILGLISGLIGLILGLRDKSTNIELVEVLKWAWGKGIKGLTVGLIYGLIYGVTVGVTGGGIVVLVGWLIGDWSRKKAIFELISVMKNGLRFGVTCGLMAGIYEVLKRGVSRTEIEVRTIPNQGIQQSAKNAVTMGLVLGLLLGWLSGLLDGSATALSSGLLFGLLGGLAFGGLATIEHFTLRFVLYRTGYTPWNLTRFLDYATERIFLRKVGGGYIFIHRLLMDYFASLENNHG